MDTGQSRPGQLVDTVGPRTLARGTRDRWSTPQAMGPEPKPPGLVEALGTRTWARVAGGSW